MSDLNSQNSNVTEEVIKKRWYKRPLFFAVIIVILILGYFLFQFGSAYNTMVANNNGGFFSNIIKIIFGSKNNIASPADNEQYPMPSQETDRLDVLILGMRGGTKQEIDAAGGLLTDTIQVVSIDRKTNKASMVSIPRDLYINMLGVNGKINEAYERGLARGNGIDFVKEIFSRVSGIYIDKVVIFNFDAFQHIVDAIGGIDITLDKPFDEPTQWGYDFHLPAGVNHLDGQSALYYVRSRYSSSDFDRARRQQEVVKAIKIKATKDGYLTNPLKITDLLNQVKNDIKTDFQIWDINDLMTVASHFSSDSQISDYVIDTTNLVYETKTSTGEYILLPKGDNFDGIKNLFTDIIKQISTPSPSGAK
jgi:LCP family protein required for cell wall assembly